MVSFSVFRINMATSSVGPEEQEMYHCAKTRLAQRHGAPYVKNHDDPRSQNSPSLESSITTSNKRVCIIVREEGAWPSDFDWRTRAARHAHLFELERRQSHNTWSVCA
ncbi:hypothetical protein Y032_0207g2017 [Ancylostoma ceylanicum]|nr:hypothetical protein Y032_0207g2017 [Ancylostoma ceylanicum]